MPEEEQTGKITGKAKSRGNSRDTGHRGFLKTANRFECILGKALVTVQVKEKADG